jgi:hypothetical protein
MAMGDVLVNARGSCSSCCRCHKQRYAEAVNMNIQLKDAQIFSPNHQSE